jgi:hypothetical protein
MSMRELRPPVRAALLALSEVHGGRLEPDIVLEAARDERSPLHGEFEWDTEEAAYRWRLEQARALIRSVRVVVTVEDHEYSVPVFVRDPEMGVRKQGYVTLDRLKLQADVAREALVAEFGRVVAALDRARAVAIGLGLGAEVERMRDDALQLKRRAEGGDDAPEATA